MGGTLGRGEASRGRPRSGALAGANSPALPPLPLTEARLVRTRGPPEPRPRRGRPGAAASPRGRRGTAAPTRLGRLGPSPCAEARWQHTFVCLPRSRPAVLPADGRANTQKESCPRAPAPSGRGGPGRTRRRPARGATHPGRSRAPPPGTGVRRACRRHLRGSRARRSAGAGWGRGGGARRLPPTTYRAPRRWTSPSCLPPRSCCCCCHWAPPPPNFYSAHYWGRRRPRRRRRRRRRRRPRRQQPRRRRRRPRRRRRRPRRPRWPRCSCLSASLRPRGPSPPWPASAGAGAGLKWRGPAAPEEGRRAGGGGAGGRGAGGAAGARGRELGLGAALAGGERSCFKPPAPSRAQLSLSSPPALHWH